MGIDKHKHQIYHYTGIYRGTVTYNDDPDVKGKIKIFVHGVYPDEYEAKPQYLPWAEPAMPLFGGGWTNEKPDSHGNHLNDEVGWCSVPHAGLKPDTGSQVYLFFEHGDINHPIYFASVQSGPGWFSEHPNQHVFRSDNVHVRIDQNTADKRSTTKFDSYNQMNSLLSIADGTKKQTQTRIDIQIQAKQMVAVNLQISGDVNMRQIGDMYIEQIGNRHETLSGNRYVKHVGNTYIEHEGIYISRQKGQFNQQYIEAQKLTDVIGNVTEKTYGNVYKEVQGEVTERIGYSYTLFTGRKFNITVTEDMTTQVMKNYKLNVVQSADIDITRNCAVDIGRFNQTQTGMLQLTTSNDIQVISKQGGISMETLGQFDLLNAAGAITSDGYKNLGLKGNIKMKSHMGNIAIETVGDKEFEKTNTVVPWNPSFLNNVQLLSMIISDFDPDKLLFSNKQFQLGNIGGLMNFIMDLPMMAVYDGLPVVLPVKMIAQNPNSEPVKEKDWKAGAYKKFTSIEDDWQKVTNDSYWKVLGKVVGNIDIKSWSGDINIKTEGRLGNGGNINIIANDPIGTFAPYQGGTVNIKSKAKKTIYTDPRNLFLDSAGIMNRTTIATNGAGGSGKIMKYINVGNQTNTAGCPACMADYALSFLSGAPISKQMLMGYAQGIKMHEFNSAIKPNTITYKIDPKHPGVMGFGHAYDIGMIDDFCTKNHGNVTINSDGSLLVSAINKYVLDANTLFKGDAYHFEATVKPNWQYGNQIQQNQYVPEGVNLGNKVILKEIFGKQYSYIFTHNQVKYVIGGMGTLMYIPNTVTDADIIDFNVKTGDKTITVHQSYNDMWVYTPIQYLDPTILQTAGNLLSFVSQDNMFKDPLAAPRLSGLQAYTQIRNNDEDYHKEVNRKYNQTTTKTAVGIITIINDFNEQDNQYYKLSIQEINTGGVTVGHNVNREIGCPMISNVTTKTQGSMITQNFEASLIDQESHKALMMTSQSYDSLLYNVDVKAATEQQNYIGTRNIGSNMVTWAVSHLNFTQK